MTDRYAVIGNPVAHSKSPRIHAEFARQTGQDMVYDRLPAPLDAFAATARQFFSAGGKGLNVTLPFKHEACALAQERSPRAERARAVNILTVTDGRIMGDNTDGAGLVRDITVNLRCLLRNRRILLMGAGGASWGVIAPVLDEAPQSVVVANRTIGKAVELAAHFARDAGAKAALHSAEYRELAGRQFDVVINATSAGLSGEMPPLPGHIFAPDALAYDMVYGRDTPFLEFARRHGARAADGLGMLVEQAAEAFFIWRGVRPRTAPVIAMLKHET